METLLLKYAGAIGQNGLYIVFMGWCIMSIRALTKSVVAMSEAMKNKTEEKMCEQKHSDLDRHMNDFKDGQKDIVSKLADLTNFLLRASSGE